MKEDRAREGKKARYRKMGFGPMMDKGEIDFGDKHPLTKKRLKNFKKKENPMEEERFNAGFRAKMKKAGFKDSEIGDTRLKAGGLSGGQAKIAAKAPPPNVINEKDFEVLRAEKAKGRGMGLQDEKVKPGKVQKANLGLMFMKKAKDKGAKGLEFLSPLAMLKRFSGKKAGGVMKYKRGSGLDLPVISSVKPAVHTTKKAQKTAVMKEQFNKQKSRMGKKPYSSMAEMRKAKGFKPGESATDFNKRRMALEVGKKALKATTVGKIALGVGTAGVAAQQYLKSKMNKKKNKSQAARPVTQKMGGGMMQKPMGYRSGTMVKARGCKLGRTRPTKIT
jgi:hypothetical protein